MEDAGKPSGQAGLSTSEPVGLLMRSSASSGQTSQSRLSHAPVSNAVSAAPQLDLLLHWPERRSFASWARLGAVAVAVQFCCFMVLLRLAELPVGAPERERSVVVHKTHLYLPPDLMTQRAPNRTQPAKSVDLQDLLAQQSSRAQAPTPESSRKHFEVPKTAPVHQAQTTPQIQPPNLAGTPGPPQAATGSLAGLQAPNLPAPKSDSPFQDVGSDEPVHNSHPTLHMKASVDEALKSLAQTPDARHLVITDQSPSRPLPGMPGSTASPAAQSMKVELKSDSDAPDFRAYLTHILAIVRSNWHRVTPESVRLGQLRGENSIELVIDKDGSIPKLVIGESSNVDALDRASVAGVSMSNPLPPLPGDFKGAQVRVAFTFKYNMPE